MSPVLLNPSRFGGGGGGGGGGAIAALGSDLVFWGQAPPGANGDHISSWTDHSGLNNHAFQPTSGNQPLVATGATPLGLSAVDLGIRGDNGFVQVFLEFPNILSGATAGEIIAVLAVSDPPTAGGCTGAMFDFGTSGSKSHYPYVDSSIYEGSLTSSRRSCGNPTPALSSWRTYRVASANNDFRTYIDGTLFFNQASGAFAAPAAPHIGATDISNKVHVGKVSEFVVVKRLLTSTEAANIEAELHARNIS